MNDDVDRMSLSFLKYREFLAKSKKEIEKEEKLLKNIEASELKKNAEKYDKSKSPVKANLPTNKSRNTSLELAKRTETSMSPKSNHSASRSFIKVNAAKKFVSQIKDSDLSLQVQKQNTIQQQLQIDLSNIKVKKGTQQNPVSIKTGA